MLTHLFSSSLRRNFLSWLVFASLLIPVGQLGECRADDTTTQPREIFICTSSQMSPALKKSVDEFTTHASEVPLLKALIDGKEASDVATQQSEDLIDPKSYKLAAHDHLVVIGLRSQDPLLVKVWGFNATIDETDKSAYSEGFGYMKGDIGWVESDRNPFLHSRRIKSAPEDTVLVKISGTSEAGVVAALGAFQRGMLNGFVVAGPLSRPKTTLLDLDPSPDPAPGAIPAQVKIGDDTGALAGWNQIPEQEYRAVLEAGGVEPKKMWRYKYLPPGMLEQKPSVRWLGGVSPRAYGNAIDIIECNSVDEASAAAENMAKLRSKNSAFTPVSLSGSQAAWQAPQITDEVNDESTWNIIVTSSGPYLFLSTLPPDGTSAVINAVVGQSAH
jgi:hypothetical protein